MFGLNLGNLVVHLLGDPSKFHKMIRTSEVALQRFASNAQRIGRKMSMYITAPLTLIGGASVRAFGNFNDAMTQSLAIMGNVSDEMRTKMEATALELAGRSITAPRELARAYYYLASAGLNAEQSVAALATVEQFAVAGMFDMSQATDLLTDAQSALGMTVSDSTQNMRNMTRISDVLVKANTLANASVEQFSRALTTKAASALRLVNKDVEEGVAVLAAFADQGVKGELAGERLHIVLRDLQRASLKEADAWKKLGLRVYDARGKMLPLVDIIEQLEDAFSQMSDQQKKASAQMLGFQDRSFSALQTLLGTSDKIRAYEAEIRKAGGTTQAVAEKQLTSFNSQMKILWNRVTIAAIEIGEVLAPWIERLGGYVSRAINWFRGLDSTTKQWIVGIGAAVAAMGPLLIVLGFTAGALGNLITLFSTLGVAGLAWIAVAAVLATAVWTIADALTDANLGILDFFNSVRFKGLRIGTHMEIVATYIWQAWDLLFQKLNIAWLWFRNVALSVAETVWRVMARVGKFIANIFLKSIEKIVSSFVWLATSIVSIGTLLGVLGADTAGQTSAKLERMLQRVQEFGKSINEVFDQQITQSLDNSQRRQEEYFAAITKLNEDYAKKSDVWAKVRRGIYQEDAHAVVQEEKARAVYQSKVESELAKVQSALKGIRMLTPPEGGAATGAGKKATGGFGMSPGQFRQVSLRRISLVQSARPRAQEQQVHDPAAVAKLEELIQLLSNRKAATAVLG